MIERVGCELEDERYNKEGKTGQGLDLGVGSRAPGRGVDDGRGEREAGEFVRIG